MVDQAELISAAQAGDRSAFDELVRQTYVDTYTLAVRLCSDEEDARDVVQDAYLRAWKGIGRFRGDAAFSTWMYRITANCAVDASSPSGAGSAPSRSSPATSRRTCTPSPSPRAWPSRAPDLDQVAPRRRRAAARSCGPSSC